MDSLTLVVVDMQEEFLCATREFRPDHYRKLVRATRRAINRFRAAGRRIVFLEYISYGFTIPELTSLVAGYQNATFIQKDQDCGLYALQDAGEDVSGMHAIVCGVNRDYCVFSTLISLQNEARSARMLTAATYEANGTYCDGNHGRFPTKNWAIEVERDTGKLVTLCDLRVTNENY